MFYAVVLSIEAAVKALGPSAYLRLLLLQVVLLWKQSSRRSGGTSWKVSIMLAPETLIKDEIRRLSRNRCVSFLGNNWAFRRSQSPPHSAAAQKYQKGSYALIQGP
ncbi:MAG: hypothetical protein JWO91_789, partial [Acidobacteriaceae bacterium]|nr:hypothetical protein [Acidobacteriaceae bacterium]